MKHLNVSVHAFCGKWLVLAIIRNYYGACEDSRVVRIGLYATQAEAIMRSVSVTLAETETLVRFA